MNNNVYIYNPDQSTYYIQNGVKPKYIDKHRRTGKIFWVFDYYECQEIFKKWINKKY